MSLNVVRVRNPLVLNIPAVASLISDAWPDHDPDVLLNEIRQSLTLPSVGFLLAWDETTPVGLAVVMLPVSTLDKTPQVAHFYSTSTPTRNALKQATIDFISHSGYTKFWALNHTGYRDKVWMKAMRPKGWEVNPIGTLMEFEVHDG